jgi:hypothetical protein
MQALTPEQKQTGQDNYYEAVGVTRRDFIKGVAAAGAVSGAGLGAMYFGYGKVDNPVRIGIIGTGDEGNVLIGGCTPDYVEVKAIADIRPSSIHRAFHGDWASDASLAARPGLMKQYGFSSEKEARKQVKFTINRTAVWKHCWTTKISKQSSLLATFPARTDCHSSHGAWQACADGKADGS